MQPPYIVHHTAAACWEVYGPDGRPALTTSFASAAIAQFAADLLNAGYLAGREQALRDGRQGRAA